MKYSTIKLLSTVCALALLILSQTISAQETEPNNTVAQANSIAVNGSINGDLNLNPVGDFDDYFSIPLNGDGKLTLTLDVGAGLSASIALYRSNGAFMSSSTVAAGPGTTSLSRDCLTDESVIVRVDHSTGAGTYTLTNSHEVETLANDIEPNNNAASATALIEDGDTFTGHLGYTGLGTTDTQDWFKLVLPDDGFITVSGTIDSTMNASLTFYHKNGSTLNFNSATTGAIILQRSCNAKDTMVLRVLRSGGGCGSYSLTFDHTAPPPHAQDVEPNNVLAEANFELHDGDTVEGRMGYTGFQISDVQDWYKLILPDDGTITVSGTIDSTMNASLAFYHKNGSLLNFGGATTGEISLARSCNAKDTMLVRIFRSGSGCGSYSLTFDHDAPPPHAQDVEPNNTLAEANFELHDGETVEGRMGFTGFQISDNIDWYKLILPDDGSITVSGTIDSTMNANLAFYHKNGSLLNFSTTTTGEISLQRNCNAMDTMLVRILISGGGCGSYSLTFDHTAPPPHDQDIEPNNVLAEANFELHDGDTVEGRIGYSGFQISDSQDWYKLILPDDGIITVSGTVDSTMNASLAFYHKNGSLLNFGGATTGEISLARSCNAKDTILVRILISGAGCGSYSLTFDHEAPMYSNDIEPNDAIAIAIPMANGEVKEGHLNYTGFGISDPGDFYAFTVVQAPFELDAKITMEPSLTGRIAFYGTTGGFLAQTANQTGNFSYTNTITTAGTYYLRVVASSGCGSYSFGDLCGEYPDTPLISASDALEFCEGGSVILSSTAADSYLWSTGETTQSITVSSSGDYSVTIFDINGCPAESVPTTVIVNPLPDTPSISVSGGTDLCEGESAVLMSSTEASYLWNTKENTQSITVNEEGTYSVTVTDDNGCASLTASVDIFVNALPATPTISPAGPITLCDGEAQTLTSSVEAQYLWSTSETSQSIDITTAGSYSVTVTDEGGCSSSSLPVSVTVETPTTWYADDDEDGYGDPFDSLDDCEQPEGYVGNDLDCDDTNEFINPDGTEVCDGEDNNCDGNTDEGIPVTLWFADSDGDGFGDNSNAVNACAQPVGFVADNTDCDDTDEFIFIGATCDDGIPGTSNDVYGDDCICAGEPVSGFEGDALSCADGIDNDGDGFTDCDDPACQALSDGCATCFNDGTSFADAVLDYFNNCPSNIATDPTKALGAPDYSGALEHVTLGSGGHVTLAFTNNTLVNSGDNNPDLFVFEVGPAVEASTIELRPLNAATENALILAGITDVDEDGFYEFGGIGGSTASIDIDAIVPGQPASSLLFDAIKIVDVPGSCSGNTPGADIDAVCALSSVDCVVGTPCDDFEECTVNDALDSECECVGELLDSDGDETPDCEDGCPFNSDYVTPPIWYADVDGDGFGDAEITQVACDQPEGFVDNDQDCDDTDEFINPDATEVCDGEDNNCDGEVDEGLLQTYFLDEDGDDFGGPISTEACSPPGGYVDNSSDCDDDDDTVYPGAPELCDGKDNDCDESVDEDGGVTWFIDEDGDGFGSDSDTQISCDQPTGYVANADDCDDNNDLVNPDASEICDGIDNDCDGTIDLEFPLLGTSCSVGVGECENTGVYICSEDGMSVTCDAEPGFPSEEICDGLDNDCNGLIDDECTTGDCSSFITAPVDLSKSMRPVPWPDGVIDRVQLKWYKDSPKIKYSSEDNAACDIEYWPVKYLDAHGDGIVYPAPVPDTTLVPYTKVRKTNGNPLFKWPLKFRNNQGNYPVISNTRYNWRVRCYCDHGLTTDDQGQQIITPWSEVKMFNVPNYDPITGIYIPPIVYPVPNSISIATTGILMELYPNPSEGSNLTLNVVRESDEAERGRIRVLDMRGAVIWSQERTFKKSNSIIGLEFGSKLPQGIYVIELQFNEGVVIERFIVH